MEKARIFLVILVLMIGLSSGLWGQQLGIYEFTGTSTADNQFNSVTAQPANAAFSTYTRTGCLWTAGANYWNSNTWDLTFNAGKYNSFTITPTSGYQMSLVSIVLLNRRSSTGSGNWSVRSSLDNYASDIYTGTSTTSDVTTTVTLPVGTFTNISTAITFRLYSWGASASGGTWRNDNVSLNGTITPVSTGNDATSEVLAPTAQVGAANIASTVTASGSAVNVFSFKISDPGSGDGSDTQVNQVTIKKASGSADWTDHIAGAQLWDGSTQITTGTPVISDASIVFPITSGNLDVPDGDSRELTLKIWLNATNLVDNATMTFQITAAAHGFSASIDGSGFATNFAGDVIGNAITITSTATNLLFTTAPSVACSPNTNLATPPVVTATDANGNKDTDFTGSVTLTNSGSIGMVNNVMDAVAGVANFANFQFTAIGNATLSTTNISGLTDAPATSLITIVSPSANTDYFRSKQAGNWGDLTTWESSADNSDWHASTLIPDNNANIITILNGHTVTVTTAVSADQLVVAAGGQITVSSGQTLTINDGDVTDLTVNGTIVNSGTITNNGQITFASGSSYYHARTAGAIPLSSWDVNSTCYITGFTSGSAITNLPGQTYGNLVWNCPTQTAWYSNAHAFTVAGNFTILSTGGLAVGINLFTTAGASETYNFMGNVTINGGKITLASTTGVPTVNIMGDLTISALTVNQFDLAYGNATAPYTGVGTYRSIVNLYGNFNGGAGATFATTSTGYQGQFNFMKTGIQTYTNASTTNNIDFTVNSGTTLSLLSNFTVPASRSFVCNGTLNCGTYSVTGSGSFTLAAGATLITANATGIAGTIAVSGTQVFDSTANYVFEGEAPVSIPNGIANDFTVNNPAGVTLSADLTVNGDITFTSGGLDLNGNTLTLANSDFLISGNTIISDLTVLKREEAVAYGAGDQSISKIWNIQGTATVDPSITLTWTAADDNGAEFSGNKARVWQFNGTNWVLLGEFDVTMDATRSITFPATLSIAGKVDGANDYTISGTNQTLPVVLSAFTANFVNTDFGCVELKWRTESETDNQGFNVYRSTQKLLNTAIKITPTMVVEGNSEGSATEYLYTDKEIEADVTYYYWLENVNIDNTNSFYGPINVKTGSFVPEPSEISLTTRLKNAYPNPFNPSTTVSFDIAAASQVKIAVYNAKGQIVKSLFNGSKEAGQFRLDWNGQDSNGKTCTSGIYFIKMNAGKYSSIKKVMMMK